MCSVPGLGCARQYRIRLPPDGCGGSPLIVSGVPGRTFALAEQLSRSPLATCPVSSIWRSDPFADKSLVDLAAGVPYP